MIHIAGLLGEGKEIQLLDTTTAGAGSEEITFSIDAESVLLSLYVGSVAGDLAVTAYTVGLDGQEIEIISFPTVSAPTAELLLRKAASTLQKVKVTCTYSGVASFNLRARGVAAGASSVKIEGAASFQVSQNSITTSAEALVPAALVDRSGILIINVNSSGTLWVAETLVKATAAAGAPVYPNGGSMAIDLAAGQALYGVASSGSIDVRIVELGAN